MENYGKLNHHIFHTHIFSEGLTPPTVMHQIANAQRPGSYFPADMYFTNRTLITARMTEDRFWVCCRWWFFLAHKMELTKNLRYATLPFWFQTWWKTLGSWGTCLMTLHTKLAWGCFTRCRIWKEISSFLKKVCNAQSKVGFPSKCVPVAGGVAIALSVYWLGSFIHEKEADVWDFWQKAFGCGIRSHFIRCFILLVSRTRCQGSFWELSWDV